MGRTMETDSRMHPAGSSSSVSGFDPMLTNYERALRQVPTWRRGRLGVHVDWQILLLVVSISCLLLLALIVQLNLLFWGASLGLSILIISFVVPGAMIRRVEVARILPDNGVVSQPMSIRYEVRNTRRYFSAYSLRTVELVDAQRCAAVPRAYIPRIGPGQTCSFDLPVTPTARGEMEFAGTRLGSLYPFGLLARFRTVGDRKTVPIYPALGSVSSRLVAGQSRTNLLVGDTHFQRAGGSSTEFYSLREYHKGDNPRLIHWRRSAQAGQLLVRDMTQFATHRFTVILDTYVPDLGSQQHAKFEQAVSFVATLLCNSLDTGHRAALICLGVSSVLVPPMSGRDAQHRILKTLSLVQPQTVESLPEMAQRWRWTTRWRGNCLLVTVSQQSPGLTDRLAEIMGPLQVMRVGSAAWSRVFVPPVCLAADDEGDS